MHPPTPARAPCHLPPVTHNSSLGQRIQEGLWAPLCPGPLLARQDPSWAGPRQVPGAGTSRIAHGRRGAEQGPPAPHCPLPAPRCRPWSCPTGLSCSSFSSPGQPHCCGRHGAAAAAAPQSPSAAPRCSQLQVGHKGTSFVLVFFFYKILFFLNLLYGSFSGLILIN